MGEHEIVGVSLRTVFFPGKLFELIGACASVSPSFDLFLNENPLAATTTTTNSQHTQISVINHQFINGNKNCWNKQSITISIVKWPLH